jgi:hypothetical protein
MAIVTLGRVAHAVRKLDNHRIRALCTFAPPSRLITAGQEKMQLDMRIDLALFKNLERGNSIKPLRSAAAKIRAPLFDKLLYDLIKLFGERKNIINGNIPMSREHTNQSFHIALLSLFHYTPF